MKRGFAEIRTAARTLAAGAGVLFIATTAASAQPRAAGVGVSAAASRSQPGPPPASDSPTALGPAGRGNARDGIIRRDSAWWVPLTSTIVPGFGQAQLGQSRAIAYAAVETYAIIGYLAGEGAVRRERGRYLALARDIARAFVPGNSAIGDWNYYEAMEKHIESGVFDRSPGTGTLTPESDPATFNGSIWLKARQLSNWPNIDVEPPHASQPYQAAVAYYVAHAVGPEFRWSWRNAQLEWDVYRQSIRQKNQASRDAGHYLAVLALNHLLSTVDAFVTLRLRGGVGAGGSGYGLAVSVPVR